MQSPAQSQTPQVDVAKLEKDIKDANDVYNTSLEEFSGQELTLRELESSSFNLLQGLYKQFKFTDPSAHHTLKDLENQYNNSLSDIEENRRVCYEKQGLCLRNLQKLRSLQNNYLVGLINGLQTQVAELKGTSPSSSTGTAANSSTEQRTNNLA